MSPTPLPGRSTPDVRAVVRALDALTTQVKRLANHTANPASFTRTPPVADDRDTPTTPVSPDFTSPLAGRIELRKPCPYCGDRQMIPTHQYDEHVARLHPDVRTGGPGIPVPPTDEYERTTGHQITCAAGFGGPCECPANADEAEPPEAVCRRMETRTCPPSYNGPCGDRPCARFESDDETPWLDPTKVAPNRLRQHLPPYPEPGPTAVIGHWLPMTEQQRQERQELAGMVEAFVDAQVQQARASEEDERCITHFHGACDGTTPDCAFPTPGTGRRRRLRVLLNRLNNGIPLSADEAQALTRHVATEICDANDGRKEVQRLGEKLRKAHEETAIDMGRDLLRDGLDAFLMRLVGSDHTARLLGERDQARDAIERVRTLVVQTAQAAHVGTDDHTIGRYDMAVAVLAALDGAEQPTTEGN